MTNAPNDYGQEMKYLEKPMKVFTLIKGLMYELIFFIKIFKFKLEVWKRIK